MELMEMSGKVVRCLNCGLIWVVDSCNTAMAKVGCAACGWTSAEFVHWENGKGWIKGKPGVVDEKKALGKLGEGSITFTVEGKDILRLDQNGFYLEGEVVKDKGKAHKAFLKVLRLMYKRMMRDVGKKARKEKRG